MRMFCLQRAMRRRLTAKTRSHLKLERNLNDQSARSLLSILKDNILFVGLKSGLPATSSLESGSFDGSDKGFDGADKGLDGADKGFDGSDKCFDDPNNSFDYPNARSDDANS